ncbi:MAG: exo-alpha-sialidase [Planctomycetota bacterium]|nr:exo-alpha-sialidase [Planctomycetota bacterium]
MSTYPHGQSTVPSRTIIARLMVLANVCCFYFAAFSSLATAAPPIRLPDSNREFGTIFNNDTNNILYALDEGDSAETIIAAYRSAIRQIAEARPGIMAQNVGNPDPVIYRSEEATSWSKYIKGHESAVMTKMLEAGTDPFQVTIEVCHELGIPVVASYRMNAEDFYEQGLEIQDFGRKHKHLAIPGAFCLDPAHPVVYQHRMAIFREVAEKYDIDGIEFDFRRWTHMISDPLTNHPILTKMVRETREMLDEVARRKGKKRMILGARVGPSLETPEAEAKYAGLSAKGRKVDPSCRELGLDVKTWVQEGYVDYLSPSLFWPDWPGLPLTREFANLVQGKNIGIYPTVFPRPNWLNDSGEHVNRGPIEPWDTDKLKDYKEGLCGVGLRCYDEGADGVSMYNWYFHLHLSRMPRQWQAYYGYGMGGSAIQKHALSVLGNPTKLRDYQKGPRYWPAEYDALVNDWQPKVPSVLVMQPKQLPANLTAKRIQVGIANDAKPSLGILPSGEILLLMNHTYYDAESGKVQDESYLCRSTDGGNKWSHRQLLPLLGRDPYLTVLSNGTLLVTAYLMPNDTGNTSQVPASYIHRSIDGGKRWTSMRINPPDVASSNAPFNVMTSRNVLELRDGTVLVGVSTNSGSSAVWSSRDQGETWDKAAVNSVSGFDVKSQDLPWFGKAYVWEARQGDLLTLTRCRANALPALANTPIPPSTDTKPVDRIAVFRSKDRGVTWKLDPELGMHYGEQYPSLLRLQDGRRLFTFTVAGVRQPLGLRGVLSEETVDGFVTDFVTDRIVLEQHTPVGQSSGGGFGNTIQLKDGQLISASSYRDAKGTTFVEAIRWELPSATN